MNCPNCRSESVVVSNRYNSGIYWPRQLLFVMMRCRVCQERFASRGVLFGGQPRQAAGPERSSLDSDPRTGARGHHDSTHSKQEGSQERQNSDGTHSQSETPVAPPDSDWPATEQSLTPDEPISEHRENGAADTPARPDQAPQDIDQQDMDQLQTVLAEEHSHLQQTTSVLETERGEDEQLTPTLNHARDELQQILESLQQEQTAVVQLRETLERERAAGREAAESLQELAREMERLRAALANDLERIQEAGDVARRRLHSIRRT